MLSNLLNYCGAHQHFVTSIRRLTTMQVSTALRPFYFAVHPDLFEQHPDQRTTNENSLKQLNMIITMLQSKQRVTPLKLLFYMRERSPDESIQRQFRLITIELKSFDVRQAVLTILKTCSLPTQYVDEIMPTKYEEKFSKNPYRSAWNFEENFPFNVAAQKPKKEDLTLQSWLEEHQADARQKIMENRAYIEEVSKLKRNICMNFNVKEVQWECGWNYAHFRGCLYSLTALLDQYPDVESNLYNRVIVFAAFTGVSLDGHIMLNSAEVRHNWLDTLRNVHQNENALVRIPAFEKSVSQVLRGIKVRRRKFMPKILAGEYERNLQQITTSLSDYLGTRRFPSEWPSSLDSYELVVETEAGPLMVSPTGQLIVPASLPASLFVNFITNHLDEAKSKMHQYESNKITEEHLHQLCVEQLELANLRKEDNVTPDLMISCCDNLLKNASTLKPLLSGLYVNVTTYYSLFSDGNICIPWNWKL